MVERAEKALGVFNAPEATQYAKAASETAQQIATAAERFGTIQSGIGAEREASQAVTSQGYRLTVTEEALTASETALASAAAALQGQGPQVALSHLATAQAQLERGVASGSGAPALRTTNERRLAELEARGAAATTRIAEGRRVFDKVDDFAESTWSDIRGNGSEAQATADQAQRHWEQARQGNTMEAQAFYAAKESLDAAIQELDHVEQLIAALVQRLQDLEAARSAAPGLLNEAERSLNDGLAFLRANDPDVGKGPETQLREATEQLALARAEAGQPKPDWLKLAAAATTADRLADTALAGARSEAATMTKLRQQVEQLRPLVSGEVNKIAKFVNVRGEDITPPTMATVKAFIQRFEQAQSLDQRAAQLEEDARRTTLEQTIAAYAAIQTESAQVYQAASTDAQRLEKLRTELKNEMAATRAVLGQAEALLAQAGKRVKGEERQRLNAAKSAFDSIRLPVTGEANLTRTTAEVRTLAQTFRDLEGQFRSQLPTVPGGGLGPVIITGGNDHHSDSSGPTWGSGGGGGGSFGGGGGGGGFGGGGGGGGW